MSLPECCSMCTAGLNFHDRISHLSYTKLFSQLVLKAREPKENEWTSLSCIVLEDEAKFEVVALGTGTKCIGRDKMSKNGDILNDSHAEVICRRAFQRYVYENILSRKSEIFKFNSDDKKFHTKKDVKFHFFSTHVPCGDAAIFAKQDVEDFGDLIIPDPENPGETERKKIKLERDIFRTGAKCLESDESQDLRLSGANYHVTGVVRTKPGRGVPTLSVSCSDKLAKWCHLGIQGALLAILLNSPIYLSSFTIAGETPFNEEAMKRALYKRLGDVDLFPPYLRNEITLGQANLEFAHRKLEGKKPWPISVIWLKGENVERQIEIAVDGRRQGVTKKQLKTCGALKICKMELFKKFIEVVKQFNIELDGIHSLNKLSYKEAKMLSKAYQKSWSTLQKNFKAWTVKDNDLMNFCIS